VEYEDGGYGEEYFNDLEGITAVVNGDDEGDDYTSFGGGEDESPQSNGGDGEEFTGEQDYSGVKDYAVLGGDKGKVGEETEADSKGGGEGMGGDNKRGGEGINNRNKDNKAGGEVDEKKRIKLKDINPYTVAGLVAMCEWFMDALQTADKLKLPLPPPVKVAAKMVPIVQKEILPKIKDSLLFTICEPGVSLFLRFHPAAKNTVKGIYEGCKIIEPMIEQAEKLKKAIPGANKKSA
jgi:hypothetical protein